MTTLFFQKGFWVFDRQGREIVFYEPEPDDPQLGLAWRPDGRLLLAYESGIYLTDPDLRNADRITRMDFKEYGGLRVSPDGSRIAFQAGNHIWVMDGDGRHRRQLTTSSDSEHSPTWSPDGKYLAFAAKRFVTNVGIGNQQPAGNTLVLAAGSTANLAVIPADGRRYDLASAGSGFIPIERQAKFEFDRVVSVGGHSVWVR